jgi:hypothetical protein
VAQAADGTELAIGLKNPLAKRLLVFLTSDR